ncbi:protein ATP1B4 isoform X2 [Pyxicephalus adspersus]|uniref:protein ATP1B4 isoform X2 n=1 Tax=Pyxicephalus adspersus TaxID=30357 RepID=UPI003B5B6AC5
MERNSSDQRGNYLHPLDNQDGRFAESERHNQMEQRRTWEDWMKDLKHYIWNPEKKEVLGRDAKSWCLILLFYFVLYAFLTGMFALCIYGLLSTISPYVPTYRDRVFPPGVSIRPHVSGFHYSFTPSEESTWSAYSENLQKFLEAYDDEKQIENNIVCTPGHYFIQEREEHEEKKACQFRRSMLQNCSGIDDPSFGFSKGKPCFILKMNRKANHTLIGDVHFYPVHYFDLMYFPFYGKLTHVNYTSPLVAIHFTEVTRNTDITIQCKINGQDIINDHKTDRFLGRIVFTMNIR